MKTCECPDWKPNIDIVNGLMCSPWNLTHGSKGYTGKTFKYCPWCGGELKEVTEENIEEDIEEDKE